MVAASFASLSLSLSLYIYIYICGRCKPPSPRLGYILKSIYSETCRITTHHPPPTNHAHQPTQHAATRHANRMRERRLESTSHTKLGYLGPPTFYFVCAKMCGGRHPPSPLSGQRCVGVGTPPFFVAWAKVWGVGPPTFVLAKVCWDGSTHLCPDKVEGW